MLEVDAELRKNDKDVLQLKISLFFLISSVLTLRDIYIMIIQIYKNYDIKYAQ